MGRFLHLLFPVRFTTDGSMWLMTEGPNFIVIHFFHNLIEDIPSSNGTFISPELHRNILYTFLSLILSDVA